MNHTSPLRTALEAALVASPDDLATHMAYADHLAELGDPRGEFIQLQLALEDPSRSPTQRESLLQREQELLDAHAHEWLGETAACFLHSRLKFKKRTMFGFETYSSLGKKLFQFRFERGWLASLHVGAFNTPFAQALNRSPTIQLLRDLVIDATGIDDTGIATLAQFSCLDRLRRFQFGPEASPFAFGKDLAPALEKMNRLEELRLYGRDVDTAAIFAMEWPRLRVLHVYHICEYPLGVLATNPSLTNLLELSLWPHALRPGDQQAYIQPGPFRELCFSPHLKSLTHLEMYLSDIGDDGCRALVESGLLGRLRVLDLNNGCITDEGAQVLAASPQLRRLERLRISGNSLTNAGITALAATGITLDASNQYSPATDDEREYLWYGDCE